MPETIAITVNGRAITVERGTTVAAAILTHGVASFRESPSGEVRAPLCGMGICFECRVNINGRRHRKSCQILCEPDMEVSSED